MASTSQHHEVPATTSRRADRGLTYRCFVAVAGFIATACGGTTASDEDVALDVDTLTAETGIGTVQAQRAAGSFVGAVDDGQAIGVAFLDEVGGAGGPDAEGQIVVYYYDREDIALMIGALDDNGPTTLTSMESSDFDATVELVMGDDAVSGTATVAGEQPVEFTAEAATGDAGVYWAQGSDEDRDARCDWVVLADGRQWGCVCVMPPMMPEHPCCQMMLQL